MGLLVPSPAPPPHHNTAAAQDDRECDKVETVDDEEKQELRAGACLEAPPLLGLLLLRLRCLALPPATAPRNGRKCAGRCPRGRTEVQLPPQNHAPSLGSMLPSHLQGRGSHFLEGAGERELRKKVTMRDIWESAEKRD